MTQSNHWISQAVNANEKRVPQLEQSFPLRKMFIDSIVVKKMGKINKKLRIK